MFSWEYDILRTLLRRMAGHPQDAIKIVLGSTMLLALGGPSAINFLASIFAQCTFARAKAMRAPSMQTDRFIT